MRNIKENKNFLEKIMNNSTLPQVKQSDSLILNDKVSVSRNFKLFDHLKSKNGKEKGSLLKRISKNSNTRGFKSVSPKARVSNLLINTYKILLI